MHRKGINVINPDNHCKRVLSHGGIILNIRSFKLLDHVTVRGATELGKQIH